MGETEAKTEGLRAEAIGKLLSEAIGRRDEELTKVLLDEMGDLNRDEGDILYSAVKDNRADVARVLIGAGARVDGWDHRCVRMAIANRNLELTKLLLENGADVRASEDAAVFIILKGNPCDGLQELTRMVLEAGDYGTRDPDLAGAIWAGVGGEDELKKLLPTMSAEGKADALKYAAFFGQESAWEILMGAGANPMLSGIVRRIPNTLGSLGKHGQLNSAMIGGSGKIVRGLLEKRKYYTHQLEEALRIGMTYGQGGAVAEVLQGFSDRRLAEIEERIRHDQPDSPRSKNPAAKERLRRSLRKKPQGKDAPEI
jgi:hypothetical protein